MADAAWPTMRKKHFEAITAEEHQRIIAAEKNQERRLYYDCCGKQGARSQTSPN
jgi:hypothetical protein